MMVFLLKNNVYSSGIAQPGVLEGTESPEILPRVSVSTYNFEDLCIMSKITFTTVSAFFSQFDKSGLLDCSLFAYIWNFKCQSP